MTYEFRQSPNYQIGGITPRGVAVHITGGGFDGSLSWLLNPSAQVSAHFLISKAGRVVQLVKLTDRAWAQGITSAGSIWTPVVPVGANPNGYLISIEHEGKPGDADFMNPLQYAASLDVHIYICQQMGWDIVNRDMIVGHYQFDRINRPYCPSSGFPFQRIINDINISLSGDDPVRVAELLAELQKVVGELNNQKGINSDLQFQLTYVQDLKSQVENELRTEITKLNEGLLSVNDPAAVELRVALKKFLG